MHARRYNTRLFKAADGSYTVLLAGAETTQAKDAPADDAVGQLCRKHSFEGKTFTVRRGDYAPLMARIVSHLREALPHCDNAHQTAMIEAYIESFAKGSIDAHKDASRHWIKDKGPAVESYIGFIESYRDPSGARGEWEGFVACVNREVSRKFQVRA
jgi:dipeptidyl-peptidase-3